MQGEVWLPIAPFTHIYGFLQGVLAPVSARAEVVIPERFKPELVVELLAEHRVTVFGGGPPAIYAGMLAAANLPGADLSALRVCPAGGAPMPVELHARAAAGRAGRGARARPAYDAGLPQPPGGNGADHPRRLHPHRRHRPPGR